MERLEEEGEEGMVHSLLSGLPDLYDEDEIESPPTKEESAEMKINLEREREKQETGGLPHEEQAEVELQLGETSPLANELNNDQLVAPVVTVLAPGSKIEPGLVTEPDSGSYLSAQTDVLDSSHEMPLAEGDSSFPSVGSQNEGEARLPAPTSAAPTRLPSRRIKTSLCSLLLDADTLYSSYPAAHPALSLSKIMGPRSVVNTWSANAHALPSDGDAESMVLTPELVVYPYIEEVRSTDDVEKEKRRQRSLKKLQRLAKIIVERRTLMAGVVLVLGVAIAVYRIRTGRVNGYGRVGIQSWSKVGGELGGVLVTASEKIFNGFKVL